MTQEKENRSTPKYDSALTEAIQKVYRVYGPDLAAFFRDVQDPPAVTDAKETSIFRPRRHAPTLKQSGQKRHSC